MLSYLLYNRQIINITSTVRYCSPVQVLCSQYIQYVVIIGVVFEYCTHTVTLLTHSSGAHSTTMAY